MIIDLASLGEEGKTYRGEEPADSLDLGPGDDAVAAGPMAYSLTAARVSGNLVVRGAVEASVRFLCSRCAVAFVLRISDRDFLRVYEDVRWDSKVDLTPDMRETIILRFPSRPLCSVGCSGLCPRCGKNLNAGSCTCASQPAEGLWRALDDLPRR